MFKDFFKSQYLWITVYHQTDPVFLRTDQPELSGGNGAPCRAATGIPETMSGLERLRCSAAPHTSGTQTSCLQGVLLGYSDVPSCHSQLITPSRHVLTTPLSTSGAVGAVNSGSFCRRIACVCVCVGAFVCLSV